MELKDIACGLQTKLEVTCNEQADLIKETIGLLYKQRARIEALEYRLSWQLEKGVAR